MHARSTRYGTHAHTHARTHAHARTFQWSEYSKNTMKFGVCAN